MYIYVCVYTYVYIYTYTYMSFNLKLEQYNFFLSAHETLSRIDHILGCKTRFGKCKKIKIIISHLF